MPLLQGLLRRFLVLCVLGSVGILAQLPFSITDELSFEVISPPSLKGFYPAMSALFGEQPHPYDLVRDMVLSDPLDACDTLKNPANYTNKMILIQRGTCALDSKARAAFDAGAAGVVIYNCAPGAPTFCVDETFTMSGVGEDLTLPAIFIPFYVGDPIATELGMGNPVSAAIPGTGGNMTAADRDALIAIITDPIASITFDEFAGTSRPWTDLIDRPDLDGCQFRLYGIWCKNGRVHSVKLDQLTSFNWIGGFSSHFGDLTAATVVSAGANGITGAVPCELGQLRNLTYLTLYQNSFTSWPASSCMNWPNLRFFVFSNNFFTDFPSGLHYPNLTHFLIDGQIDSSGTGGIVGALGTDVYFPNDLTKLIYFDISKNSITGSIDYLSPALNVEVIGCSSNQLSSISASVFDNKADLVTLACDHNLFDAALPTFTGSVNLDTVDLSANSFTGPVPASWASLTLMTRLILNNNLISSPISSLKLCSSLIEVNLGNNNLTTAGVSNTGSVTSFVFQSLPNSVELVTLSHNLLTGSVVGDFTGLANRIRRLDLSFNLLTGVIGDELWKMPSPQVEVLDFSNNQFEGPLPDSASLPYPTLRTLHFDGNPNMEGVDPFDNTLPLSLPVWVAQTEEFVFSGTTVYVCPIITGADVDLVFSIDPQYYAYGGCVCEKGRYGAVPACPNIPVFVDDNARSFSDSEYGNDRRRTVGIDTSWVFNATHIATEFNTSIVRVIYFNFTFHADFTDATDSIDVHEGGADLKGASVAAIRGTDNVQGEPVIVRVFNQQATVNFKSRKETGSYFTASLTFADVCPRGFSVSAVTGQCEEGGLNNGDGLTVSQQGNLVVLAYFLSVLGGWTTFIINENVLFARSKMMNPIGWLLATGVALGGASIWSWNGIAQAAVTFDQDVTITYIATTSMACIVLPMGLCFIGLWIASLDPYLMPAGKNGGLRAASVVSSMTRESKNSRVGGSRNENEGEGGQAHSSHEHHEDVEEEAQAKFKKAQSRKVGGPIKEQLCLAIRQLNRYVFISSFFIAAAVVITHWVWLTSYSMDASRNYNYGNDLLAILVVYGICVPVTFVAFFFRGVLWNFVAAFLFSAAQLCCYFIDIKGQTYHYELKEHPEVTLERNVVVLIACAVAAVCCFGFIGFNVIKLKVSRGALQYLLKKFKKEIQRMESEIQRERHVNSKMLEKMQQQQHALDLITYCTPTLSKFSVATCLAGKIEARISSGAQLKYTQVMGNMAPFLEAIGNKLNDGQDQIDPTLFSKITVPVLLSHPVTIELFKDEFVKHNSPETIMFWLNVQLYKKIKDAPELVAFGREIVDKFVSEKGEYQINISGSARNKLLDVAHSGHFDHKTFQSVETETLNLMSNQYLMQFRATPAFKLCAYILEEVALQEKARQAAASVQSPPQHAGSIGREEEKESVTRSERASTVPHVNIEMTAHGTTTSGTTGTSSDAGSHHDGSVTR